jgi:hypothetical protein
MTATTHHRDTVPNPNAKRQPYWPDPRVSDERPGPRPLTDAERRDAAAFARHSLGLTHAAIDDTRGVPCGVHDARRWQPCWGSSRSGVEGYCRSRIERGKRDANRKGHLVPQPSVHALTITVLPVPPRRSR